VPRVPTSVLGLLRRVPSVQLGPRVRGLVPDIGQGPSPRHPSGSSSPGPRSGMSRIGDPNGVGRSFPLMVSVFRDQRVNDRLQQRLTLI